MKKSKLLHYYNNENDKKILLHSLVKNIVNKIKKQNCTFYDKFILPLSSTDNSLDQTYAQIIDDECFSFNKDELDRLANLIRVLKLIDENRVAIFAAGFDDCPAYFTIAFPERGGSELPRWRNAWGLSGGRGLTREDSIIGALGEAAECMSVWSRGDRENLIVNPSYHPFEPRFLNAAQLLNLSQRQIEAFQATNAQFDPRTLSDPPFPFKLQLTNFSNRFMQYQDKNTNHVHFVPTLCGLIDEECFYGLTGERVTSTNGSAVAESVSVAADKAMFELIERDAVSIWWYNRITRQRLPDGLVEAACGGDLHKWLGDRERQFHLIDISSDLGVPVAAALSYEADGSMIADGYAAGRTWPEAVLSATLEMLQAEISLSFMQQKAEAETAQDAMAHKSGFYEETLRMNLFCEPFMHATPSVHPASTFDVEISAPAALSTLEQNGIQVVFADLTRPEMEIPVARVLSPQLRDWQPRFGPGRLYQVPVAMKWLDHPNTEASLNPRAFLN